MDIKNLKPNGNSTFKQGYYTVKNKEKYKGDLRKVIYRSSWEKKLMIDCDLNSDVVQWSSEPIAIPYINPLDRKEHNYYIDFFIAIKDVNGDIIEYLIEVKPTKDYKEKPIFEGKKTPKKIQRYQKEMETWLVNNAKFKAADLYARRTGRKFMIMNEENFFGKKKGK